MGPAVLQRTDLEETANELADDANAYARLLSPFLRNHKGLLGDLLGPLGIPRHPLLAARFGLRALRSAKGLAKRFRGDRARALFAGCAAHSILPLEAPLSAAVGVLFLLTGHVRAWPVAREGSASIAEALVSLLNSRGGRVETGVHIRSLADLPPARMYLFDTSPRQLASIAGEVLPSRYLKRLAKFRFGPASFKVDYALDGPIPWKDPRCLEASTVHVGGTFEEIAASERAAWRGEHHAKPFVLVVQQSQFDDRRAPPGKHTGYAYCHVPAGSEVDATDAIESQIERFAPGFRERILERHTMGPADLETRNANYVGGAITGGANDWTQVFTRPVARLSPYTTPHPRLLICSASTPPGGGVHGMCGYHAAQVAKKRLPRLRVAPLK